MHLIYTKLPLSSRMLKYRACDKIVIGLLLTWVIYCLIFVLYFTQYKSKDGDRQKRKLILLWNSFWDEPGWEVGLGSKPFQRLGCKIQNCEITDDRERVRFSDAVLFHAHDLGSRPPSHYHRPHHQRWVFFMLESPGWSQNKNYVQWNGLFNWTMTYRLDSDIRLLYGEIKQREVSNRTSRSIGSLRKKERMVAWMVSNCRTQSKREDYIRRLQQWLPVDVFGRCGNFTCHKEWKNGDKQCIEMIGRKYSFYLAFENSFCKDYVTEKFFKMLSHPIVPVVRGGAQYFDYSPKRWFINTDGFRSPKKLAAFLKSLHNSEKYQEFLEGREEYHSRAYFGLKHLPSWCDLCEKLNDQMEPTKTVANMDSWWSDGQCHRPKDL